MKRHREDAVARGAALGRWDVRFSLIVETGQWMSDQLEYRPTELHLELLQL
jgi:hypothetical protein